MLFFFSFGDITPKQIRIYQKNELYLKDNCKKFTEPLCKVLKVVMCHFVFQFAMNAVPKPTSL